MNNLYLKRKRSRENLLLTFLIIFKSTQASVLAFSPITTILVLMYAMYIFRKRKLKVDKVIIPFVLIYILVQFLYLFSFGANDFYLSTYILIKLIYAYLTIKCLAMDFFACYEKIIYKLAFISIPLFLLQLVNYDLLFKIIGFFQNNIPFLENRNDRFANSIFFTMESHGSIFRNSGFAWEPKGFVNFLVIAVIINLVNHNFKFNKRLIVLLIAVLTTTSTTGYLITFVLIPLFYIVNKRSSKVILFLFAMVPVLILVISLDFGVSKIQKEIDGRDEYKELLVDNRKFESRSLGRFPSFIVDFNDAVKRPFFGYGYNRDERTQSKYTKLVRVNGMSDHFATFGFVGFFLLLLTYYKGLRNYIRAYNLKFTWVLMIIIMSIYFASTLTSHPFWMMFYFLFLVKMDGDVLKEKYKKLFK